METTNLPISVIAVAEDASDNSEFQWAVAQVAQRISRKGSPKVVVDLLPEPGYGAAKGAAMWSRLLTEVAPYCKTLECDPFDSSLQLEENHRRANEREL